MFPVSAMPFRWCVSLCCYTLFISNTTSPEFRSSRSIHSLVIEFTQARANYSSEATAKYDKQKNYGPHTFAHLSSQVFRFASSKNASLFGQRKNPRKFAWTVVYRKMHKKGIAEEVAKKRSRKTVKHQRGIVGADLATIAARRNQTAAVRSQQRLAAITKAKSEKKEKEVKKAKVCVGYDLNYFESWTHTTLQPARPSVPSGPKVSKQQMKGGKGGR